MDDEEDLEGSGALGQLADALEGAYTTTPEAREAAQGILSQYMSTPTTDAAQGILSQMEASAREVRQALKEARARLLAQRYNPGAVLLAASSALGSPTRTGSFGETMGNVSSAIAGPLAQRQEFQRQRSNQLLDLDQALAQSDQSVLSSKFQLELLQERLQSEMAKEALRTLGKRTGTSGAGAVRLQKISDLVRRGITYDDAVDIVDRNVDVEVVPELGVVRGVDRVTKRAWEIPLETREHYEGDRGTPGAGKAAPEEETPPAGAAAAIPGPTLWDAALYGTGLWSAAREGYNKIAGWVNLPQAERTTRARQLLRTETRNLKRAIALNRRFPTTEQQAIQEDLDIIPGLIDNPEDMHNRMVSIDFTLRQMLDQAQADAEDVTLPQEDRSDAKSSAAAIQYFLGRLSVPPSERLDLLQEPTPAPSAGVVPPAQAEPAPGGPPPAASAPAAPETPVRLPKAPPEIAEQIQGLWPYMTEEERQKILLRYGGR